MARPGARQWSWTFRLIIAISVLQPCRSEFLDLNGYSSTESKGNDNDSGSQTYVSQYNGSPWTVQLGQDTCVQGVHLTTSIVNYGGGVCSLEVGSTECFSYTSGSYSSPTLVNCGSVICGSTVTLTCATNKMYVILKEIDLEVAGSSVITTAATGTTVEPAPFYYSESETLQYADCAEVQAADSAVIEAVGFPFFCSDVTYLGYKSCAEILLAGHQETGYYEIDPDGIGSGVESFLVFCDMCTMTSVISECPVDYLTFENSCYKISTSTRSRSSASSDCTAANSHLVDITSQDEQDFWREN
ncbi:uncharacterized protein [Amphiura filiformis]|uniref:uncharacterized protein n=1 Tax=Amphiura filiformis TaxID=82378 RepID=UPI003B223DE5